MMDICNIITPPELCKPHFTLEELEEMNRDMESIMELTRSLTFPHIRRPKSVSNVIPLRPDKASPLL